MNGGAPDPHGNRAARTFASRRAQSSPAMVQQELLAERA